jgi:hypothetical protein
MRVVTQTIRPIGEVSRRMLCVAAVVTRAVAESVANRKMRIDEISPGFQNFTGGQPEETPARISRWLECEALTGDLSPKEATALSEPFGSWTERDFLDGWWRREALMVLEWSMGIIEPMPPADTRIAMEDLLEGSWLFRNRSELQQRTSLRSPSAVWKERDTAEFWLWRVRTSQLLAYPEERLREMKTNRDQLAEIVRRAAVAGEKGGAFRRIDGDFPALGKAFRQLNETELDLMRSISVERLHGLNWICMNDAPDWDNVSTNT